MQKITTFLTFKEHAEEAMNFYVSIFKNSRVLKTVRNEMAEGPMPKGMLLHGLFELDGQQFMAMDGGDYFSFAQGTSLFVTCETQEEIDHLYDKLAEDGEAQPCGWVTDKYGVAWQVVPPILGELLTDKDPAKATRVTQAMLKMKKIIIKDLQDAYDQ